MKKIKLKIIKTNYKKCYKDGKRYDKVETNKSIAHSAPFQHTHSIYKKKKNKVKMFIHTSHIEAKNDISECYRVSG